MAVADEVFRAVLDPPLRDWRSAPGLRDASVLAPWCTRDGEDFLLYTVRRHDLPTHAGEVSFPGGARERDEDALECALRECTEEIGVDAGGVRVLGRLPERESIGGYLVHVFVGRLDPGAAVTPDPEEVEEILEIPVRELRRPGRWEWRERPSAAGAVRRFPCFLHRGRMLWGLTARFTMDLLERLGRK